MSKPEWTPGIGFLTADQPVVIEFKLSCQRPGEKVLLYPQGFAHSPERVKRWRLATAAEVSREQQARQLESDRLKQSAEIGA